jgi:peptidoglycan/xylan/chitin deacetylase (PgdA/CDA1 family)
MLRRRLRSLLSRFVSFKQRPIILGYHRIADEPIDPWRLAVSPAHFEEQLTVLRRTRRPMPLGKFVRELRAGTLPENAIALTFDDGYVDNLVAGRPRLAAADVPATAFIVTGYLGRSAEFWWDELARLILGEKCVKAIEFTVRGTVITLDLRGVSPDHAAKSWRALIDPARTRRQQAYVQIWREFRLLNDRKREAAMIMLRSGFAVTSTSGHDGRAMTQAEVRQLAQDRLIEIGAHTVTHPMLTALDSDIRGREITESKAGCEAVVGAEITTFAYPYGEFDTAVRAAVGAAGFEIACSSIHGPAIRKSDPLALPRVQVLDWDGDAFERALNRVSAGA